MKNTESIQATIEAVSEEILDCRARLQRLEATRTTLQELLKNGESDTPSASEAIGPLSGLTQEKAILRVLADAPTGALRFKGLLTRLQEGGKPLKDRYLHTILYRMRKKEYLEKVLDRHKLTEKGREALLR